MSTQQILIRLPKDIAARFKAAVPARQRSKVIERLLAPELQARESARDGELSEIAARVETEPAFAAVREVSVDVDDVAGEAID